MTDGSVHIQTISESVHATPSWFGEVVLIVEHLRKHGILAKISEEVRVARRRFGHYEVIGFLAVLFGYATSGERTLEAFYQHLQPFAVPFMALFERDRLPSRSALSRFSAALTEVPVEALRTLFLNELLNCPLTTPSQEKQTGGQITIRLFGVPSGENMCRAIALHERPDTTKQEGPFPRHTGIPNFFSNGCEFSPVEKGFFERSVLILFQSYGENRKAHPPFSP